MMAWKSRGMTRREFLRSGAAAGAGLAVWRAWRAWPTAMAAGKSSKDPGYKVRVKGGLVKSAEPDVLTVRATGPSPKILLKSTCGDGADMLRIRIENVRGNLLQLQGEDVRNRQNGEDFMLVEARLDPAHTTEIAAETNWHEAAGFHFAAISDTHLGDAESVPHFERVRGLINYLSPMFTVDAGDVIDVDEDEQWAAAEQEFAAVRTPMFTTIGNHDSYLSNKNYIKDYGALFSSYHVGDTQFLLLDNAQKYNTASLYMVSQGKREAQWDWLREQLEQPAARRMAFFHFPVFGNRSMLDEMYFQRDSAEARQREVDEMMALFAERGVGHILYGHIHSPHREERDGIVHLRLGGGGGSRASHTDDAEVSVAHVMVTDSGVQDVTLRLYFEPEQVTGLDMYRAPDTLPAGAPFRFFACGVGANDRRYAVEPTFSLDSGPGTLSPDGRYNPDAPGAVQISAAWEQHKVSKTFTVV